MKIAEGISKETTVSDTSLTAMHDDTQKSALLEETPGEHYFSTFFSSTVLYNEPWHKSELEIFDQYYDWLTPVLTEEPLRRSYVWRAVEAHADQDYRPSKDNSDRITLLARKYVAKDEFSDEDRARLAIVTERVRQLFPSVSHGEYQTVEQLLDVVKRVAESDTDIRKTLRLDKPKNA